ncbi:exopolysaccharide biosynthesis protein [Paracoccus liaowanqingii]|uniref:exopolysaccharide biosynthesis protein n=1 Tax=Paracoccus liaowanqingii TaxID=2560053 RepID=UPI00143CD577|nr:exopolysaccharide biosynthesis protein [Paracoccus liaowanqingii]
MKYNNGNQCGGVLSEVIFDLIRLTDDRESVTVLDIRNVFGNRCFGPFLLFPAMLEISPIGGIPGVPTAIALVIVLFSIQIALGFEYLWLPKLIERREIGAKRFRKAMEWLLPVARWTDRAIKPRLDWATKRPWLNIFALICIALAATVPLLEIIPFASTIPMAAIALFGISILSRDGVVAILAALVSIGAFYLLYSTVVIFLA